MIPFFRPESLSLKRRHGDAKLQSKLEQVSGALTRDPSNAKTPRAPRLSSGGEGSYYAGVL